MDYYLPEAASFATSRAVTYRTRLLLWANMPDFLDFSCKAVAVLPLPTTLTNASRRQTAVQCGLVALQPQTPTPASSASCEKLRRSDHWGRKSWGTRDMFKISQAGRDTGLQTACSNVPYGLMKTPGTAMMNRGSNMARF